MYPDEISPCVVRACHGRPDGGLPLQGDPAGAHQDGEDDELDPSKPAPPPHARDPRAEARLNAVENRSHLHHVCDRLFTPGDGLPDGHHLVDRASTVDHRCFDGRHVAGGRGRAGNGLLQPLEGVGRRFDLLGDAIDPCEDPALALVDGFLEGLKPLLQLCRLFIQSRVLLFPQTPFRCGDLLVEIALHRS